MLRNLPATPTFATDDAFERDRFKTAGVAVVSAAHGVHDTYSAFLSTLLPALIAKFALSNAQAGLLTVFAQWPSALQPVIGYVADRVPLRVLVVLAPGVTATVMSLLGLAPSYLVLAFLLIIAGLSSAGLHAVAPVIAGQLAGSKLGRGMSFFSVAGELGRTLGPLVVAAGVSWFGLGGIAWLMIGGWAATVALYLALRSVPEKVGGTGRTLPWRQALTAMAPVLWPLALLLSTRAFLVSALTTFLPTFLSSEGAPLWLAGGALALLQAAGSVGALLSGSLSDRLGRRPVLLTTLSLPPVLALIFLNSGAALRIPVLIFLGFMLLATGPVIMAVVQESFPQNRALANGIFMAVNFILFSLTTVAIGALGDAFGLHAAFTFAAGIAILAVPMVPLFLRGAASRGS